MKKNNLTKKMTIIGICALLGVASIGAIASFADETAITAETGMPPMNNGMYMGKITAIESGSITIETMGGGHGMGHGGRKNQDGTLPTNASGETETPPELPTNASGETETPPELPTNASGETETPPELPTNASGETETPPAGGNGKGGQHNATTITFTVDSSLTSSFSVGDMVEITSADGVNATAITAAQAPQDQSSAS